MWHRAAAAILLLATAACSTSGGFGASDPNGIDAPASQGTPEESGLVVGHRMMAAGQYELALDQFRRAAFDEGVTPETISAIGTANLGLGRLGQAERQLRRAVELDRTNPAILNNLGIVLLERDNVSEAISVLEEAFALDSGRTPQIRDNLAKALAKRDEPSYDIPQQESYKLLRRGSSEYIISEFP